MGKAGQALRQVLEDYDISQYSLSVAMNVERNNIYRWVNEKRDPTAETVLEIVRGLRDLNLDAAQAFIQQYLGNELPS